MIRDWIDDFLREHRNRFHPMDWPADRSEELAVLTADWIEAFCRAGVNQHEAHGASSRLLEQPPRFLREHLAAILAMVQTLREDRRTTDPSLMTREQAWADSKSCQECGGGGMVTVWHPEPEPGRIPPTATAHCVCPYGRWMRKTLAEKDPETLRRFADLERIQFGQSRWLLQPPGQPEFTHDRDALDRLKAALRRDGVKTGKPRELAEVLA